MSKHLIIGDPHVHPEYDNERFRWLGRYIMDTRPDTIICLGDFADLPSLSSYDKGKKSFEGRRYNRDVTASRDALASLFEDMILYNARQARNRKKQYNPRMVMCLGNHEDRINRATNDSAELDGVISTDELGYRVYGFEEVAFKDRIVIDGVAYSHYFSTGVSGRPISGENIANALIRKNLMTSIQGHSHVKDASMRTRADGSRMHGISAGCFAHPDYIEGWNAGTQHMWWMGVLILHDVQDGDFRLEEMRLQDLERIYG